MFKDMVLRFSYDDVVQKDINIRHEVARAIKARIVNYKDIDFSTIRHTVSHNTETDEIIVLVEDTNTLNKFEQLPVVVVKETDVSKFEERCAELVLQGYYMMQAHTSRFKAQQILLIAVYVLPRYVMRTGEETARLWAMSDIKE